MNFWSIWRATIGAVLVLLCMNGVTVLGAAEPEPLVIAGSPSLRQPLEALGRSFEATHPGVKVQLYLDTGLAIRQTVAAMENSPVGQYFIGRGPIHIIAPGGDELIARLQTRYYVLPDGAHAYAREYLVLVVPEQLAEAPTSFAGIQEGVKRLAVADPDRTVLGRQTKDLLRVLNFQGQLDVATDARGVLDHVLSGQADAGIIFGHEAVKEQERIRVAAVAESGYEPTTHSMAMERYCPNRKLCEDFLTFAQSAEAQKILAGLGYLPPRGR
jgi:molybdate transport system substrate-binding protein